MERKIVRHATRLSAAMSQQDASYAAFQLGGHVQTADGYPGHIDEIAHGPFGGGETYHVNLDSGMGGGWYSPSQLRPLAASAPQNPSWQYPAGMPHQANMIEPELAYLMATGELDPGAEDEEDQQHLASHWYPEFGTILTDRPDPASQITVIGALAHYKQDDPYDRDDPDSHNYGWCHACKEHHSYSIEADEHESSMTDWRQYYRYLPAEVHRGTALQLSGYAHERVHNPHLPVEQRASHLYDDLNLRHMGMHWTASQDQAEHYAEVTASQSKPGRYSETDPSLTHVVVHARKPAYRDIERDPLTLSERGVLGYDHHEDQEVPVREGAPMHVTGLSWKQDGDREYQHYRFPQSYPHNASVSGHGMDPFGMAMQGLTGDDAEFMRNVIEHIRQKKGPGVPIDQGDAESMARSMRGRDRMEAAGYHVRYPSRYPRGFSVDLPHNHRLGLLPEQGSWYARIDHWEYPMGPKIEHSIPVEHDEDLPAAVDTFLNHPDLHLEERMRHQRDEGRRIHEEIRREGAVYTDHSDPRQDGYNGPEDLGIYWQAPAQQEWVDENIGGPEPSPVPAIGAGLSPQDQFAQGVMARLHWLESVEAAQYQIYMKPQRQRRREEAEDDERPDLSRSKGVSRDAGDFLSRIDDALGGDGDEDEEKHEEDEDLPPHEAAWRWAESMLRPFEAAVHWVDDMAQHMEHIHEMPRQVIDDLLRTGFPDLLEQEHENDHTHHRNNPDHDPHRRQKWAWEYGDGSRNPHVSTQMSGRPGAPAVKIDDHGDAPGHGADPDNPRAARPDSYDDESTEAQGDDKWSGLMPENALDGHFLDPSDLGPRHAAPLTYDTRETGGGYVEPGLGEKGTDGSRERETEVNGAQIGMVPEGVSSGGDGPGLEIGAFTAVRVNYISAGSGGDYEERIAEATGPFYHGGRANLRPGALLRPGMKTNSWGDEGVRSTHIHFATDKPTAVLYARATMRESGNGHVYEIEPTGDTELGYGGNELKSRHPLRVIRKVHPDDWDSEEPEGEVRFSREANVPWTDHERSQLHSWSTGSGATEGDFVPSYDFTNKVPVGFADQYAEPEGITAEATLHPEDLPHHLRRDHAFTEDDLDGGDDREYLEYMHEGEHAMRDRGPDSSQRPHYHSVSGDPVSEVTYHEWSPGSFDQPEYGRPLRQSLNGITGETEEILMQRTSAWSDDRQWWLDHMRQGHGVQPTTHTVPEMMQAHDSMHRGGVDSLRHDEWGNPQAYGQPHTHESYLGTWELTPQRLDQQRRRDHYYPGRDMDDFDGEYTPLGSDVATERQHRTPSWRHSPEPLLHTLSARYEDHVRSRFVREKGLARVEAVSDSEDRAMWHLYHEHGWNKGRMQPVWDRGDRLADMHDAVHDVGAADHHHHDEAAEADRDRRYQHDRAVRARWGDPGVLENPRSYSSPAQGGTAPVDPYASLVNSRPAAPDYDVLRYQNSFHGARAFLLTIASANETDPEDVYRQLAEDYPPQAIEWVRHARWTGPEPVPLENIDWNDRQSWTAYHQPAKVEKFGQKMDEGWDKPAIGVARPGQDIMLGDGHHRALKKLLNGQPVNAYVAHPDTAVGPWDDMHDQQIRASSKKDPTASSEGPDAPSGEVQAFQQQVEQAVSSLPPAGTGMQDEMASSLDVMPPAVTRGGPPWTQGTNSPNPGRKPTDSMPTADGDPGEAPGDAKPSPPKPKGKNPAKKEAARPSAWHRHVQSDHGVLWGNLENPGKLSSYTLGRIHTQWHEENPVGHSHGPVSYGRDYPGVWYAYSANEQQGPYPSRAAARVQHTFGEDEREPWERGPDSFRSEAAFYHGSDDEFEPGHVIDPGRKHHRNWKMSDPAHAYFTDTPGGAADWGENVYEVEPSAYEPDQILPADNYDNDSDQPYKSYQTRHPLQVRRKVPYRQREAALAVFLRTAASLRRVADDTPEEEDSQVQDLSDLKQALSVLRACGEPEADLRLLCMAAGIRLGCQVCGDGDDEMDRAAGTCHNCGRPIPAQYAGQVCRCCAGRGEHATGHECYRCEAGLEVPESEVAGSPWCAEIYRDPALHDQGGCPCGWRADTTEDFQDRGEPYRQQAGIDGTAGDAMNQPHPFTPDTGFNPSRCVSCGMGHLNSVHAVQLGSLREPRPFEFEDEAPVDEIGGHDENGRWTMDREHPRRFEDAHELLEHTEPWGEEPDVTFPPHLSAANTIWMNDDPESNYHALNCNCPDHCGNCREDLIRMRAKGIIGPRTSYCSSHCQNQMRKERALDRRLRGEAAANDPWGDNNYSAHPPTQPYGATEQPNKDMSPASYGPLAGPDPEGWGEIDTASMTQSPGIGGQEASLRLAEFQGPDTGDWMPEHQDSFPYSDTANTAGPSTSLNARDPNGIRMEEALADGELRRHMTISHEFDLPTAWSDEYSSRTHDRFHELDNLPDHEHDEHGWPTPPGPELQAAHQDVRRRIEEAQGRIVDSSPDRFTYKPHSGPIDPVFGAKRHSWLDPEGNAPGGHTREKTCQDCGLRAKRYGHQASSYWMYQTPQGEYEAGARSTPPCGPEAHQFLYPDHKPLDYDPFERIEQSGHFRQLKDFDDPFRKQEALRAALADLSNEEPQLLGGLGAELHEEPESALDPQGLTADSDEAGAIGGDNAGMAQTGTDTGSGAPASLSSWGLRRDRYRAMFATGTIPAASMPPPGDNYALDAATTGGAPGMSHDEDSLGWDEPSIQAMGQQQWSGGGADSDEVAVEPGQPSGDEQSIIAAFQRSAAARQFRGSTEGSGGPGASSDDIAAAARAYLSKTAQDHFSADEADQLIAEGRGQRARNLDLLDIEGTHYADAEAQVEKRGLSMDDLDDDLVLI